MVKINYDGIYPDNPPESKRGVEMTDKIEQVKTILDKITTSRQYGYITESDKDWAIQQIGALYSQPPASEGLLEDIATDLCLYCHKMDDKDGQCTANPMPCEASLRTAKEIIAKCQQNEQAIRQEVHKEVKLALGLSDLQKTIQVKNDINETLGMCSERSPRWRAVVLKLENILQQIDALYTQPSTPEGLLLNRGETDAIFQKWFRTPNKTFEMLQDADCKAQLAKCQQHYEAQIKEIKSHTWCAYCGTEYSLDVDAEIIGEHIKTCTKHPLYQANERIKAIGQEERKEIGEWLEKNKRLFLCNFRVGDNFGDLIAKLKNGEKP